MGPSESCEAARGEAAHGEAVRGLDPGEYEVDISVAAPGNEPVRVVRPRVSCVAHHGGYSVSFIIQMFAQCQVT